MTDRAPLPVETMKADQHTRRTKRPTHRAGCRPNRPTFGKTRMITASFSEGVNPAGVAMALWHLPEP